MAEKNAPEEAPDESVSGGAVTDAGYEKQAESQPREEQPEADHPEGYDPDNPGGQSFDYGPRDDEAAPPDEG
jgi:hypothetical protein